MVLFAKGQYLQQMWQIDRWHSSNQRWIFQHRAPKHKPPFNTCRLHFTRTDYEPPAKRSKLVTVMLSSMLFSNFQAQSKVRRESPALKPPSFCVLGRSDYQNQNSPSFCTRACWKVMPHFFSPKRAKIFEWNKAQFAHHLFRPLNCVKFCDSDTRGLSAMLVKMDWLG